MIVVYVVSFGASQSLIDSIATQRIGSTRLMPLIICIGEIPLQRLQRHYIDLMLDNVTNHF